MGKPLVETFVELIRRTSSDLPADLEKALRKARRQEASGSPAKSALDTVLENVALARTSSAPLCQDTGSNLWYLYYPVATDEIRLREAIVEATREATRRSYLRPNAVDPITNRNSGDNVGVYAPVIHSQQWRKPEIQADLMLKGGGSENVSIQFSLPHQPLGAGRDLAGVRKVVLDGIWQAQGKGCAPGVIGVGIGGDRMTSHWTAKEQLFRRLDDKNPDSALRRLEKRILEEANELGIGPMGFGGKTTVLGVKIGWAHRLPACYFVSIAYGCWALRRASVQIRKGAAPRFGQNPVLAGPHR